MTKEECTFNTLRVALLIGVATASCHLKEKLKNHISSYTNRSRPGAVITTGCPVAAKKYHTALDLRSILTRFLFP